ncbi:MAG: non-canonical purine NTP pyrophosphatase [Oscillospiraceae bacterium]|jgi:XTP/dITP diphosphohydrolase|nr:MAG: non-canonical purine NTP pyrophosphatase [Oscillospiraceae bacterium]
MKILLASHNKNKIAELEALLKTVCADAEVVSLSDVGFTDEIIEDGTTFEENALIKARTGARLGYITVADDSGLMVDALGGAPGVYSARYAGEDGNTEKNNAKLLAALQGVPQDKRTAHFVSVVACVFPDGREDIVVRGECPGEILTSPRGKTGFGYDPLFWYAPFGKTYAEMTAEEKNSISHRGVAMQAFAKAFAKLKF